MNKIIEIAEGFVKEAFNVEFLDYDASLVDLGWDRMKTLSFLYSLYEKYNLRFLKDDVDDVCTIRVLITLIVTKLRKH